MLSLVGPDSPTTYGVPDLVDIVRLIDARLDERQKDLGAENGRADLSFIGHSMGGFVVTNAVRILSDVFSPAAATTSRSAIASVFAQGRRRYLRSGSEGRHGCDRSDRARLRR
jgi:alpha-beta hydrolase superfamily lysophospholipase